MDKVRTTYQTQEANYEAEAAAAAAIIEKLNKEKEAIVDKVKMGIRRIHHRTA